MGSSSVPDPVVEFARREQLDMVWKPTPNGRKQLTGVFVYPNDWPLGMRNKKLEHREKFWELEENDGMYPLGEAIVYRFKVYQ